MNQTYSNVPLLSRRLNKDYKYLMYWIRYHKFSPPPQQQQQLQQQDWQIDYSLRSRRQYIVASRSDSAIVRLDVFTYSFVNF